MASRLPELEKSVRHRAVTPAAPAGSSRRIGRRARIAAFVPACLLSLPCDPSGADQLIADDLIVKGSQCVGLDCVQDEAFAGDTVRLKENNTRIRFIDTSAGDVLGQSWNIEANDSHDGGHSYLSFDVKSLTQDTTQVSDGTHPLYDCANINPADPFNVIGVTPAGQVVQLPTFNEMASVWECQPEPAYTEMRLLVSGHFGTRFPGRCRSDRVGGWSRVCSAIGTPRIEQEAGRSGGLNRDRFRPGRAARPSAWDRRRTSASSCVA